jgi:predicted RNA-binding protein
MTERNYWLDLFSGETWDQFLKAGANVSGFRESRWATLNKVHVGDYLVCYMTGISRFIGILEITSEPFKDITPIWTVTDFPARVHVKVVSVLTPETAIPVMDLKSELSFFENLISPNAWTGHFRASPSLWTKQDGEAVVYAILDAEKNPSFKEVDPKKLARKPQGLTSKTIGFVRSLLMKKKLSRQLNNLKTNRCQFLWLKTNPSKFVSIRKSSISF